MLDGLDTKESEKIFNLIKSFALSKYNDKLEGFIFDRMGISENVNWEKCFPAKKLKREDEIYLGEVYSNIVYNDQSREATAELVKNTALLEDYDYANYVAALGCLKSGNIHSYRHPVETR